VRRMSTLLCGCLAACSLSCAVKKPPSMPEILKQGLPETTKARDQWAAPSGVSGPVEYGWLKGFADPQMEAVVEEVLRTNLDLRLSATRVEVAAGLATQARAMVLPTVVVQGGPNVSGRFENKQFNSSGIFGAIAWELDIWGKIRAQSAAAQESYRATEADLGAARQSLAALAAKAWYLATYTAQLQQLAQQGLTVYQDLLDVVQLKKDVGEVSEQDLYLARADLEAASASLEQTKRAHQEAVRALEVLMGRYPAAELKAADQFPNAPPPIPAGIPSEVLERRPDLRAAQLRVAAAFHLVQSAKAARLPGISLTLAGGRSTNDLFELLGTNPEFWSAGANFLAPVFTGGALKAQVRIQNAQQEAATLAYGQAALRAFQDVESSLSNEGSLVQGQQQLEASVRDNEEAYRLGRVQFDVGAIDLLKVLQLQGRVLAARSALIGVSHERLTNRINLHLALGGNVE
jgi:multidrug efflux system outer membrane protein